MILDRLKFPDYNECQSYSFELPGKNLNIRVPGRDHPYSFFSARKFSEILPDEKELVSGLDTYSKLIHTSWVYENSNYETVLQVILNVGVIELTEGRDKVYNLLDLQGFNAYIVDLKKRVAFSLAKDFGWNQDDLSKHYYYTGSISELNDYPASGLTWKVSISGTTELENEYSSFNYPLTSCVVLDISYGFSVFNETRPSEEDLFKLKQHAVEQFFKHVELTDYPAA